MKSVKIKCAILILVLTSGCALTMKLPVNRFDSPEASGKPAGGHVEGGFYGANEVVIVPDTLVNPPLTASPSIQRLPTQPFIGAGIGLADRLDLSLKNPFNSTAVLGLKYQILGDTRAESKQGNFSLSVTGGFFFSNQSAHDEPGFGNVSKVERDIEVFTLDASLVAGYRVSDLALFYGGPFLTRAVYSGKIEQTLSSGSKPTYPFNGTAFQWGGHLGVQMHIKKFFFAIEPAIASAYTTQGTGAKALRAYLGVIAGFAW